MCSLRILQLFMAITTLCTNGETIAPRHCRGQIRHLHLAVGPDPATSMTVSFASTWAFPDRTAPVGGVHIGTSPNNLNRFVPEQELPLTYTIDSMHGSIHEYFAPFQHHITIDGLEPDTTYYYIAVIGDREEYGNHPESLATKPIRGQSSSSLSTGGTTIKVENIQAENKIFEAEEELEEGSNDEERRLRMEVDQTPRWDEHGRRLAPPPYNPSGRPCIDPNVVRSFKTAPSKESDSHYYPMTFGVIGDIGQFEHSVETLEHMRDNLQGIQAVVLVGDIAYPGQDGRKWDTFFDFLDDHSVFDTIPLQIAAGNHGTLFL